MVIKVYISRACGNMKVSNTTILDMDYFLYRQYHHEWESITLILMKGNEVGEMEDFTWN